MTAATTARDVPMQNQTKARHMPGEEGIWLFIVGDLVAADPARAFGPMNSARWKKCPCISGARWGPGPSMWKCTTLTSVSSWARATSASKRTEGVAAAA